MRDIVAMDFGSLRSHEQRVDANVRLGGYHMDKHSPTAEFQVYGAVLDSIDWLRLYLLGEFAQHTWGTTARVVDVDRSALSPQSTKKIATFYETDPSRNWLPLDLRRLPELAIIAVASNIETSSLTITDGNHRAIAQCWRHGPTSDVPIIVCVHRNIKQWPFIPHHARTR